MPQKSKNGSTTTIGFRLPNHIHNYFEKIALAQGDSSVAAYMQQVAKRHYRRLKKHGKPLADSLPCPQCSTPISGHNTAKFLRCLGLLAAAKQAERVQGPN